MTYLLTPEQQYYADQQAAQEAQQQARYGYQDALSTMRQQQANRDQFIQNLNQRAGLGNQVAQQGYNLWGDLQRLGLQTMNMGGDLANLRRNEARYALNAQLNLAQQQQRRSTSEIPGAQSVMRRFGY